MRSPDDYFSSSVPGWSPEPGDEIDGTIVEREVTQQREYVQSGQGDPLWWIDGKPKAIPADRAPSDARPVDQLVVTVQTETRDPEIDEDDGQRRIFVKGKRLQGAVRDALKRASAKKLADGGRLRIRCTGFDPDSQNPKNPAKTYIAQYTAPAPKADAYFDGPAEPPEDPWASSPAPAARPAPAPEPAAVDTSTGEILENSAERSPIPTVTDEAWAGFDAGTRQALLNLHQGSLAATPS